MKVHLLTRVFLLSVILFLPSVALASPPSGGYCMNPSGAWIPIASLSGTAFPGTPPSTGLYGSSDGGATWFPLQCDASGNLQTSMGNYASAPATCSTGQTYFNTSNATPYYCSATNTWTAFGGSGGSGTVNTGTIGQIAYYATNGTVVSPTSALPNGSTATTQAQADGSTKVATTAYVDTGLGGKQASGTYVTSVSVATANGVSGTSSGGATPTLNIALGDITPTSVTVPPDGVHAQQISMVGNTTNPSIPANSFGWIAPPSASFTSYFLQPSATAPAGNYLTCTAPASGVSTCTWDTPSGTVTAVSVASANGISGTSSGGATPVLTIALGAITPTTIGTATNCSSSASPAVCGSAAAGSVLIPTGTTSSTLTVNTSAVTANSQIVFYPDDSLGTKLGVTCNSTLATLVGGSFISARTPGTSFTITFNGTIVTNGVCGSYTIIN